MGWQVIFLGWQRPVASALKWTWRIFRFTGDPALKMDCETAKITNCSLLCRQLQKNDWKQNGGRSSQNCA